MRNYLKLMRLHHSIKNGLIFLPLVFSRNLLAPELLLRCVVGFIAFSLTASAVYILNDIRDVENDRSHGTKKNRPIAAGAIPVKHAAGLMAALLAVSALILCAADVSPGGFAVAAVYFILNVGYSFGLKNYPLVDVAILAAGFLLRVIFGALLIDVAVSNWLYLTVISLSFYMGLGKRRNEIAKTENQNGGTRKVLSAYSYNFLDKNMYLCLALANVFYALWCVEKSAENVYNGAYLIWSVPLVLLILMRYSLVVESDSAGDPVDVLFKDKALMLLAAVYILLMAGIIYVLP